MNLAVNARDAMPDGGTHHHRDGRRERAGVRRRRRPRARSALTVRDTGHGMDEETRAQVFEPFFTTKAGSGGHRPRPLDGVRHRAAERGPHRGGERAGRGSCFRILLPCAEGPGEAREAGPAAAAPPAGGETVLVVEDEPAIRALACEMLESHGYLALGAGSGEEALGLAVRHAGPIHLLLADVVMLGLAGPPWPSASRSSARTRASSSCPATRETTSPAAASPTTRRASWPSPSPRTCSPGACARRSTGSRSLTLGSGTINGHARSIDARLPPHRPPGGAVEQGAKADPPWVALHLLGLPERRRPRVDREPAPRPRRARRERPRPRGRLRLRVPLAPRAPDRREGDHPRRRPAVRGGLPEARHQGDPAVPEPRPPVVGQGHVAAAHEVPGARHDSGRLPRRTRGSTAASGTP